eukprot:6636349-Pyramimonas_sp.AAC.1
MCIRDRNVLESELGNAQAGNCKGIFLWIFCTLRKRKSITLRVYMYTPPPAHSEDARVPARGRDEK